VRDVKGNCRSYRDLSKLENFEQKDKQLLL
jgi:hypothetical protein